MTSGPAAMNPFDGLAAEASATLTECLVAEGLANEAPEVLPAFERAVRATIRAVEASPPDGLSLDFALAYLTGRIAKQQVIALHNARALARAARTQAEHHWRAAIETERHRQALEEAPASAHTTASQQRAESG